MVKKIIKVKKVKKKRIQLPRRLLFIPSCDKNFTESWDINKKTGLTNRDPLNFPASFRIILCGKPGCGKSNMIKNIIMRVQNQGPKFERIFVLHQDRKAREYSDIGATVITQLPENDFWMGYAGHPQPGDEDYDSEEEEELSDSDVEDPYGSETEEEPERPKTLMIIDDICFKDLEKHQTILLDRLCGYISTHCNVSLAVLNQDVFAIDPIIRKCCNVWCIWKPSDTDQCKTISRRAGLKSKDLEILFETVAKGDEDSIMIDKTPHSPYKLRLNGFTIL